MANTRPPLLILDDFGLQSMQPSQQEDLYEVICKRYEKKAMIITSNRDLTEWASIFSNPLIGSAAMDRLVHKRYGNYNRRGKLSIRSIQKQRKKEE